MLYILSLHKKQYGQWKPAGGTALGKGCYFEHHLHY